MGVGPDVDPADREPAGHAEHRHADGQHDQRGGRGHGGDTHPPEPDPTLRASRAGADPGVPPVPTRGVLEQQQRKAADDEHACQRSGGRAVERRSVLLDDRRGEGVEAEHREGAVFGQQVQTDQQPATEDRQPELRPVEPKIER
jgi:hypothetical protein